MGLYSSNKMCFPSINYGFPDKQSLEEIYLNHQKSLLNEEESRDS